MFLHIHANQNLPVHNVRKNSQRNINLMIIGVGMAVFDHLFVHTVVYKNLHNVNYEFMLIYTQEKRRIHVINVLQYLVQEIIYGDMNV